MSKDEEREEIARIVVDEIPYHSDGSLEEAEVVADAILDAGYRKTRTVTTVAELDALPAGSMILDSDPDCCVKNEYGRWHSLTEPEESYSGAHIVGSLPATILYEPEAS